MFLVLYYGDLERGRWDWRNQLYGSWEADKHTFNSLDEALDAISKDFPIEDVPVSEGEPTRRIPDPEDDRIVVWEINPGEIMKPAWHFSGWHWSFDMDCGLEQGTLPGDNKSLYEIATEDY